MSSLSGRFPMLPRLEPTSDDLYKELRPYLGWWLLETDTTSGEILICKPNQVWERTRAKDLLILCGEAAAVWLEYQNEVRA